MKAEIHINRPELSAEERAKRLNEIKRAATELLTATERIKIGGKNDGRH